MQAEGTYKHYKGNMYCVVGIAHHSETLEELVVYKALYDHPTYGTDSLWVRPIDMFFEDVTPPNGEVVPRFKKCDYLETVEKYSSLCYYPTIGRVAEWSNAPHLKCDVGQLTVSSNLTSSAAKNSP